MASGPGRVFLGAADGLRQIHRLPLKPNLMRRLYPLAAALFFTLCASAASAGDAAFLLTNAHGQPVADAVITIYPQGFAKAEGFKFDWPQEMDQHNLQFAPFVLIVPVGASVNFPNRDAVRHHVYSFSPAKAFELKLYGQDQTRSVKFDKVGMVALGCNIHDNMVAFIKVVDTPFAAKTDATGQAVVHGLPAGPIQLHIWQPYLKAPGNEIVRAAVAPASGVTREAIQIDVRAAPDRRGAY
jgi:plastocyanin